MIELMIAVAIISILAAVAIPRYTGYVYRAKQTEGLTMIGTIKIAQQTHLAQRDCFVNVAPNPPVRPSGIQQTWDAMGTAPDRNCADRGDRAFEDIGVRPSAANMWYQYECRSRWYGDTMLPDDFSCSVTGDLDSDGMIYELIYCTDYDYDDTCIAAGTGTISRFPFDAIRVSPYIY